MSVSRPTKVLQSLCGAFGHYHGGWYADKHPNPKVIDMTRICKFCGARYGGPVLANVDYCGEGWVRYDSPEGKQIVADAYERARSSDAL